MFECTLDQGELFKKIIVALSDLVSEGNFMVDGKHISFQGMDSSHVSLCALSLGKQSFSDYRCDRDITLGLNFEALQKVLKCMNPKDRLSINHEEGTDVALFIFEGVKEQRISNFELKLMDIDAEQLGIPLTTYEATVKLPSADFQRICRDLAAIGDSVSIEISKEGVTFSVAGAIGTGSMCLKGHMMHKIRVKKEKKSKKSEDEDITPGGDDEEDENNNEDTIVKDEVVDPAFESKKDNEEEDEDLDMGAGNNDENIKNNDNDEDNDEDGDESEYEYEFEDIHFVEDDPEKLVLIQMEEPVKQQFALRYLNNFTKATNLSKMVVLSLGPEVPLMVEYRMDENGYIRYYLAPKIDEEE